MAAAFNLTAQLNLRGPNNVNKIVSDIRRQLGTIKGDVDLKINASAARNVSQLNATLRTLNSTLSDTNINARKAADAIALFTSSSSRINSTASATATNINKASAATTKIASQSTAAAKQIEIARTEMEEFGRQSALAVRRFAAFSGVTTIIFSLSNAFRQAFGEFVEFDKAFVKLQQVTGKTGSELQALSEEVKTLSIGLGVSSSSLIDVAQTLAQAGLSARDTEKALRALALSDLAPSFDSMNDTVEGSIALMRQFGISAGELEKALGSVNAVAAGFAVEASDIIAAIQRTGGVFAAASKGVSEGTDALNEFIAVFTSVRATTRESAETIATGLRTIFTRIQREGTIEALREFGVTLTDAEGKFVGAYKAVQLLSEGLNRLDPRDIKFSQIVEELGGFRQIGKVIPLIQQFATAQEALKVAQAGQGSLANDAVKAQLSLANQISKVREEFLAFVREIGSSDTFTTLAKTTLGFASGLIKIGSALKGVLPVLTILALGKGASSLTQFGSGFIGGLKKVKDDKAGQTQSLSSSLGSRLGGAIGGGTSIDFGQINNNLISLSNTIDNLISSLGTINGLTSELTNNTASLVSNTASIDALTAAVSSLNLGGGTTLNRGGKVLAFARGGVVPGTGNRDTVPAMLQPGEFVIRKKAVETLGAGNLHQMNKYATGGPVEKYSASRPLVKNIDSTFDKPSGIPIETAIKNTPRLVLNKKDTLGVDIKRVGFSGSQLANDNPNSQASQDYLNTKNARVRGLKFEDLLLQSKKIVTKGGGGSRIDAITPDGSFAEIKSTKSTSDQELFEKAAGAIFSPVTDSVDKAAMKKSSQQSLSSKPDKIGFGTLYEFFDSDIRKMISGGFVQKFATGGKALGARSKFKELSPEEILQLSTPDLIAYGKALAQDIFTTEGAGIATSNEFIEVPQDRIVPELESSLVSYMGKRGFWREKVSPFGRPTPTSTKQNAKLDKRSALEAQVSKYSDEVAAREQQWTSISSGSAIDNYLLSRLTDPILSDYKTVRSGGSLAKTFHQTRLRKAVNQALEEYDDFDYSAGNIDKLVSGMAAKRFSYGGLIQKFMAGGIAEAILGKVPTLTELVSGPFASNKEFAIGEQNWKEILKEILAGQNIPYDAEKGVVKLNSPQVEGQQISIPLKDAISTQQLKAAKFSNRVGPDNISKLKKLKELIETKYAEARSGVIKASTQRTAEQASTAKSQGLLFNAAGMLGKEYTNMPLKISKNLVNPIDTVVSGYKLDEDIAQQIDRNFSTSLDKSNRKEAKRLMINQIIKDITGGNNLVLDFDRTLVTGADKILKDPNSPEFAEFSDENKVKEALYSPSTQLTRLGKSLVNLLGTSSSDVKQQLLDRMSILSARPQSTLPIIQSWLASQGLPIYKLTGVGGPGLTEQQVAQLKASLIPLGSSFVDDNSLNVKTAEQQGIKSYLYKFGKKRESPDLAAAKGYQFQDVLEYLGAPKRNTNKNSIDFPFGLGSAAKYFNNMPPDVPTDAKRTIRSASDLTDNITNYLIGTGIAQKQPKPVKKFLGGLISKFANGGKASRKVDFEDGVGPSPFETAKTSKLGSKIYDLQKSSGLNDGEFNQLVQFGKTNDFTEQEFKDYLSRYLQNKTAKKNLVMDNAQLRNVLLGDTRTPTATPRQLSLAEQLKGEPDAKYNPKYDNAIKRAMGGVIKLYHGSNTGPDDSILKRFQEQGILSSLSQGYGQGSGFYVWTDRASAEKQARSIAAGSITTKATTGGKMMIVELAEMLDPKNWDLDYEMQSADIADFIYRNFERLQPLLEKSKSIDLGEGFKDFTLREKYDEYIDESDQQVMRKFQVGFNEEGNDVRRTIANVGGDIRTGTVIGKLVKALRMGDPTVLDAFEEQFFASLKPGQALKYVGSNPLRPSNIETFAKGGSAEDTVPALLTPGEFVINKKAAEKIGYAKLHKLNKADKLQGYNKGGAVGFVQKFADGGIPKLRDNIDPSILKDITEAARSSSMSLKDFSDNINNIFDTLQNAFKNQGLNESEARSRAVTEVAGQKAAIEGRTNITPEDQTYANNLIDATQQIRKNSEEQARILAENRATKNANKTAKSDRALSDTDRKARKEAFMSQERARSGAVGATREEYFNAGVSRSDFDQNSGRTTTREQKVDVEFKENFDKVGATIQAEVTDKWKKLYAEEKALLKAYYQERMNNASSPDEQIQIQTQYKEAKTTLKDDFTTRARTEIQSRQAEAGETIRQSNRDTLTETVATRDPTIDNLVSAHREAQQAAKDLAAENDRLAETAGKRADADAYVALMAKQSGMSISQYTKKLQTDIGSVFMKLKDAAPKAVANARGSILQNRDKLSTTSTDKDKEDAKRAIKDNLRNAIGSSEVSGINDQKLQTMIDQLAQKLSDTSMSTEQAIASVEGLSDALTNATSTAQLQARAVEEVAIESGVAKEKLAEMGDAAVKSAQKMDGIQKFNAKLQSLSLAVTAVGSTMQLAIEELGGSQTAAGAATSAVVGGASQRIGAGMALAGQVNDPKLKGLILLGTAATAVVGAFKDAHNAIRNFNIEMTNKKIELSMDRTANLFDKFNKDNTKLDILSSLDKELKNGARLVVQNLQNELTIPKGFWANMLDLGGGQESAQRSQILEKEGIFSYLKSTSLFGGGEEKAAEYRQNAIERLAPEQAVQTAQSVRPQADNIIKLLEAQLKASGGKIDNVLSGLDKNQSEILARTNPLINEQILNLQANTSLSDAERKARIANIIETEAQKVATNQLTASLKQIELEQMDRASRNFVTSLDRMFNNMDRALSKTSFELDSLTRSAELSSLALSGQAQAGDVSLKSINVLQNSRAYSGADQEAARSQASSFFGSQSDTVSALLQVGDKLEDTILSTINKTIESSPGATDEKIATNVRFALDRSLKGLNLPPSLADSLSKQAKTAFEEMRSNRQENVSFDELAEKVSGFSRVMDGARRAQELAVKTLEFWQKNLNEYSQAMNTNVALQVEANSQMRRASQIQYQGTLELKKAFGRSVSLQETRKGIDMGVKAQTGGLTNPADIGRNILRLEDTRRSQQSMSDSAANRGAAGRDEFMLMQNRLKNTNVALRENYDALKQLADSGELAGAALAKINEVQQKRQAGVNVIEKLVTSDASELTKFSNAMARLQNNMAGNVNMNTTAEQRSESLQAFNMIAPMLGDQQGAMKANVLESMLQESGVGVDSTMQEVLNSLRNPEGDPQMAEAIQAYKEGVSLQSKANEILAELNTKIAENNADVAAKKLSETLANVKLNFDQQQLISINAGIAQLVDIAKGNKGVPGVNVITSETKQKGGVIYASAGELINFQPKGTDTVPAMLTPGEFVVNKAATQKHLPLLKNINSGTYNKGGSVRYYQDGGVVDLSSYDKPIQETQRVTKEGLMPIPEEKPTYYNMWGVKRSFYASPENQNSSDLALGVEETSKNAVLTDWVARLGGSYDTLDFNQNMTFGGDIGALASGAALGGVAGYGANAVKKKVAEAAAKKATEAAVKTGAKKLFGGLFQGFFKRIPGAGYLFALKSLVDGNYQMAMIQALAATASLVPGPGTAISALIDGATILAGAAGGAAALGAIRDNTVEQKPKIDITTESKPGPSKYMSPEPLGAILDPNYMAMLLDEKKIQNNKIKQGDEIEKYKAKLKAFRDSLPKPVDSNLSINNTPPTWTPQITKIDNGPIKAQELTDIGGGGLAQTSKVKLSNLTYQDSGYAALVAMTSDSSMDASKPDSALDLTSGKASPFGLFLSPISKRLATLNGDLKLASGDGINLPKSWKQYTKDFTNIADKSEGTLRLGLNDTAKYKEQYDKALAQIDATLQFLGDDTSSGSLKFEETALSAAAKQEALDLTALLEGRVLQAVIQTQIPPDGAAGISMRFPKLSQSKFPITLYNKNKEEWLKTYAESKGIADVEFAKTKFITLKKAEKSKEFPWTSNGFRFEESMPDLGAEAATFRTERGQNSFISVSPGDVQNGKYAFSYSKIKSQLLDANSWQLLGQPLDHEYIIVSPQTDKANLEYNPFAKIKEQIYAPSIDSLIALLNNQIENTEAAKTRINSGWTGTPPYKINLVGGDSMIGKKGPLDKIEGYATFKGSEVGQSFGDKIDFVVAANSGKPILGSAEFELPEYTNARIQRIKDKEIEEAKIKAEKAEGFEKLKDVEAVFPDSIRVAMAGAVASAAMNDPQIQNLGISLSAPADIAQVGGLAVGLNSVLPRLQPKSIAWNTIDSWRAIFSELYKPPNMENSVRFFKGMGIDLTDANTAANTMSQNIGNIIAKEKTIRLSNTLNGAISEEDAKDLSFEGGKTYTIDSKGNKTELSGDNRPEPKTYADIAKLALTPENIFPNQTTRMGLIEKLVKFYTKSGFDPIVIDATQSLIGWYGDVQDKYINDTVKQSETNDFGYTVNDAIKEITNKKADIDAKRDIYQKAQATVASPEWGELPNAEKMIALLNAGVTKASEKPKEVANAELELAKGGMVYASKGKYINFQPRGTDTVPAMLTPGEFVVNRDSTAKYKPVLEAINSGNYNRGGIVNYLNNGGLVFPNYYRRGGMGSSAAAAFDFSSFMQSLTSKLVSVIPEAIKTAFNKTSTVQQNTTNGVSSIDSGTLDTLNAFTNRLKSIADTLAGLDAIPSEIKVTGRHDVNIIINGDSALNQLKPELQNLVMKEVKDGIQKLINANRPVPSDQLANPFTNNT